jgi:hypothetical protein
VIQVLGAHVAFLHEAEGFGEEGDLQAVEDEAVDLLLHVDRHLAHALLDLDRAPLRLGRCPRRPADFHYGDEVRGIDGVRHDAALSAGEGFGELRRDDCGGRRGEDRLLGRCRVEARERFLLDVEPLRPVLLHVLGVAHRFLE